MAVVVTQALQVLDFGKSVEKGGAHGIWGATIQLAGDGSGGTSVVNVNAPTMWTQGKILMIRHAVIITNATTARAATFVINLSYMHAAESAIRSGNTVVGSADTVFVAVDPGGGLLWKPVQAVANSVICRSEMVNTNGETHQLYVSGEFWHEARLREDKTGPMIRW